MPSSDRDPASWLEQLQGLNPADMDFGLERIREVLARLELRNPTFSVISIGGTNGKGSSAALLYRWCQLSGKSVGCYSSPHLIRLNERISVNGRDVTDEQLLAAFSAIKQAQQEIKLSYFEFLTVAALWIFAEQGVDIAILEVGLGGRLDAVNAVDPDACLVTNVALDHMSWLGNDRESIAREKAGILRPGIPAVYGEADAPESFGQHVLELGLPLLQAGRDYQFSDNEDGWQWHAETVDGEFNLAGLAYPCVSGMPIANAAAVAALIHAAPDVLGKLQRERFNEALLSMRCRGRLEQLASKPSEPHVYVDVAHNPAAARQLATTLARQPEITGRTVAICGMYRDKDSAGFVQALENTVDHWVFVSTAGSRGMGAQELTTKSGLASDRFTTAGAPLSAVNNLRDELGNDDRILVLGSFEIVGEVLAAENTVIEG